MQANNNRTATPVTRYVAGRLTELRTARGWNIETAAMNCDKCRDQIGRLERGEVGVRIQTLYEIVSPYGISMAEFFKDFEGDK